MNGQQKLATQTFELAEEVAGTVLILRAFVATTFRTIPAASTVVGSYFICRAER